MTQYGHWKVNLTYYKPSGKYYSEDNFETLPKSLYEIWQDVQWMIDQNLLPGLSSGVRAGFIVQVDVPDCPHNHPHLMNTFAAIDNHRAEEAALKARR
jgi:hypothetical protein